MKHIHSQPDAPLSHPASSPASRKGGFLRSAATLLCSASLFAGGAAQAVSSGPVLTTLHSFDGTNSADGATPIKGLTYFGGAYYGVFGAHGLNGHGGIFQVNASGGSFYVPYTFTGTTDGGAPTSGLVPALNGTLYGVSSAGTGNTGVVYSFDPIAGVAIPVFTFTAANQATLGSAPVGLTIGSDNLLYITCSSGGASGAGSIVTMDLGGGSPSQLVSFTSGTTGSLPVDSLVQATDTNFWGVTQTGGAHNLGTVFTVTAGGTFTSVYSFDSTSPHFYTPKGGLMQASDGNLYGTTFSGGANRSGSIYKVTLGGTVSLVADLTSIAGTAPVGTLVEGLDHNLYGMAPSGGGGIGTIYKVTPAGVLSNVINFANNIAPLGAQPTGSLLVGADHSLWGTTSTGGANAAGTLFKVDVGFNYPRLDIEVPAGTTLNSGVGLQFGTTAVGSPAPKTFTMKNAGFVPMTVSSIAVSGLNATDFTLDTTGTNLSLNAGDSTTFTIAFNPHATGNRSATLQITSTDPVTPSYHLTLQGSGLSSSQFTFSAATYSVVEGARTATLTVNRSVSSPAQSVIIDTADGTSNDYPPFDAATAPTDYTAMTSTPVNFAIGQTTKSVVVTLAPKTGNIPNKRFTATLSTGVSGGTLGAVTTTTVQILATDTTKPTVVVTYPATPTISLDAQTNGDLTVTGTVDDAHGISKVLVTTNGVTKTATLDTASATGNTIPFSCDIDPSLGANTVVVTAYDMRNNATSVSRSITMTGGVNLNVLRVIPVTASTKYDSVGNVTAVATPARAITAFAGGTNANPKHCLSIPTTALRLTATPLPGYAFSGWSNLPNDAIAVGNIAAFAMPASDLTVTATFIAAPFTGAAGTSTTFYGLLSPTDISSPTSVNTLGFFTGSLNTTYGTFSGKLLMDGTTYPVTATFMGDGSALFGSGLTAASSVTLTGGRQLTLSYNAAATHDQITVTTIKDATLSAGIAYRAYYSSTRKLANGLIASGATTGTLNFAIPRQDQSPSMDLTTYAQGSGIGAITLYNFGAVSVAGTLADGTVFTSSTGFLDSQNCPFFAQLTTPGASTLGGLLIGVLNFDHGQPNSDVSASNMLWIRPASSAALYTAGWPNGVSVGLVGSLYSASTYAQASLGLGPVVVGNTTGNAKIVFDDGKLASTLTKGQFNIKNNSVSFVAGTTPGFSLAFGLGGTFSGTFSPNWTSPGKSLPTYKGILLQKGTNQGGYGYFISNRLNDTDPESGVVFISAP